MTPTIHDILGYQQDWTTGERPLPFPNLPPEHHLNTRESGRYWNPSQAGAGQKSMADYLYGLMEDAGQFDEDVGFTAKERYGVAGEGEDKWWRTREAKWNQPTPDIYKQLFQQETPFQDMSKEDLEALFTGGLISPESYGTSTTADLVGDEDEVQKYYGGKFDQADIDDMVSSLLGLQEGLGRVGSITDKFGLEGQLASEETGQERDISSALQAYMPKEITSRYGSLQSGGGGAGELSEAEYLASLSAGERRRGRNVRSIYGELEDKMFGGLGKWMGGMTS